MRKSEFNLISTRCEGLHKFEKQLWPERRENANLTVSIKELELIWKNLAASHNQDSQFFETILERWSSHINHMLAIRDSLVPVNGRTENPIADISTFPQAKQQLLEMLKVPLNAADKITLANEYPYCFVFHYDDASVSFAKLFNRENTMRTDINGFYFHLLTEEIDPWLSQSVIWIFRQNWPSSPKNRPSEQYIKWFKKSLKRHEVRHFLDFFYNNWPMISDPILYLEWRISLELAAALVEMPAYCSAKEFIYTILLRVPTNLTNALKEDAEAYANTVDQLERILSPVLALNVESLYYWSVVPAQVMLLNKMEELIAESISP